MIYAPSGEHSRPPLRYVRSLIFAPAAQDKQASRSMKAMVLAPSGERSRPTLRYVRSLPDSRLRRSTLFLFTIVVTVIVIVVVVVVDQSKQWY